MARTVFTDDPIESGSKVEAKVGHASAAHQGQLHHLGDERTAKEAEVLTHGRHTRATIESLSGRLLTGKGRSPFLIDDDR